MTAYNLTNLTDNVTGINQVATELNTLSNGFFSVGILFVVFIVFVLSMKDRFDFKVITIIASGVTTGMAMMFFIIGWISQQTLIIPILMFFVSIGFFMMTKDQ